MPVVIRRGAAAPHGVRGGRVRAGSVTARASRDEVAKATQALADAFAELIATGPQDWHMLQRVFTADGRP